MEKIIIVLLFCSVGQLAIAQQQLPQDVAASIQKRIEYGHTPSIVVGIVDRAGPQYYAFGTRTIDGLLVDEHTVYEIGSITKTFTGILLAQMELEGQLKAEDAAQNYLPESVKLPIQEGNQITLGQLSDHTSGLPRLPINLAPKDPANPYADYTVEQLYAFLNACTLTRPIGAAYEYSNLAAGLLGHILALKAGTSYEELMVRKIAGPLGMEETRITLDEQMSLNVATGHSNGKAEPFWDIPTLAGAGAIRSSAYDMLRYLAANMGLQPSELYPALVLSHQIRHSKAGGTGVGLGWHISEGAEGDIIWHNGGTGGARSFIGFVKETGKGVVVLTNSDRGADDLGMRLLSSTAELITVKLSAATALRDAIEKQGINAGIVTFNALKKDRTTYEFDENAINMLGYFYLTSGKETEALAVFKVNVDEFPNSFNVYDSYAEALMKVGQRQASIANYTKSLELNPDNANAVEMLKILEADEPVKKASDK